MNDPIPFVDLARQYAALKPEIDAAILEVLQSRAFIQGVWAKTFETEFGRAIGAEHAVACANGTAALSLALESLGIGRGDEVITVAHTFIATVEAICHVGAVPVLVEIEPRSYNMDPAAFEAAITPRTRAVIPVHLYGTPCDMDPILRTAERAGIAVIEDAAQAHLATYRDRYAGTLGDAGAFSFYPGKNLGAYGDAGLVAARSPDIADKVRRLADHGRTSKYEHGAVGYNQRMDGLQAAILSVKLKHLDEWTKLRRRKAALYDSRLRPAGFKTIEAPSNSVISSYHLYVVEVANRDEVQRALAEAGIATGVHYPIPLHRQPALAGIGRAGGSLAVTEKVAARVLSLPICAEIADEAIERVCAMVIQHARP